MKTSKPKVHTNIGHSRALCGANQARAVSKITIVSNSEFVATPAADRCGKCAELYRGRGYTIDIPAKPKAARKHFRRTAAPTHNHHA